MATSQRKNEHSSEIIDIDNSLRPKSTRRPKHRLTNLWPSASEVKAMIKIYPVSQTTSSIESPSPCPSISALKANIMLCLAKQTHGADDTTRGAPITLGINELIVLFLASPAYHNLSTSGRSTGGSPSCVWGQGNNRRYHCPCTGIWDKGSVQRGL